MVCKRANDLREATLMIWNYCLQVLDACPAAFCLEIINVEDGTPLNPHLSTHGFFCSTEKQLDDLDHFPRVSCEAALHATIINHIVNGVQIPYDARVSHLPVVSQVLHKVCELFGGRNCYLDYVGRDVPVAVAVWKRIAQVLENATAGLHCLHMTSGSPPVALEPMDEADCKGTCPFEAWHISGAWL